MVVTHQAAKALIERDGRILLIAQHSDNKDYWSLPGGRFEDNESLATALDRELQEEVGLQLASIEDRVGSFAFTFTHDGEQHHVDGTVYRCTAHGDPTAAANQPTDEIESVDAYKWVPTERVAEYDADALNDVLQAYCD